MADHRIPSAGKPVRFSEPIDRQRSDIDAYDVVSCRRTVTSAHGNHGHSRSPSYAAVASPLWMSHKILTFFVNFCMLLIHICTDTSPVWLAGGVA